MSCTLSDDGNGPERVTIDVVRLDDFDARFVGTVMVQLDVEAAKLVPI